MVSETEVTEGGLESQAVEAKEQEEHSEDHLTSIHSSNASRNLVVDTDDAMASVDPYGTNVYKGVKLSNTDTVLNEVR